VVNILSSTASSTSDAVGGFDFFAENKQSVPSLSRRGAAKVANRVEISQGCKRMRAPKFLGTAAWLLGSLTGWAQNPPADQRAIFPNSDNAMARALADPRIPSDVKAQLFTLFDSRLRPQEIEDQEGNTWLYQQGQKPVIIRKRDLSPSERVGVWESW
jgi:hypothetical protein